MSFDLTKPSAKFPANNSFAVWPATFDSIHSICVGDRFHVRLPSFRQRGVAAKAGRRTGFHVHAAAAMLNWTANPSAARAFATPCAPASPTGRTNAGPPLHPVRRGHRRRAPRPKTRLPDRQSRCRRNPRPPRRRLCGRRPVEGKTHRAAVNIGHRPTMYSAEGGLCVEAHLLDFAEDIYGQEIELTFLKKLREERKFPSPAALQQQIEQDVAAARRL